MLLLLLLPARLLAAFGLLLLRLLPLPSSLVSSMDQKLVQISCCGLLQLVFNIKEQTTHVECGAT